jgi:hypothetical protein
MSGRPFDNERKACDAVARSLETLAYAKRSNPRSPEDERMGAPVEYVFDLAGKTYALEHTIVEAFEGQINTNVDFAAFVGPVERALDQKLPAPGVFRLTFPIDPSAGIKRRDIPKVRAAIISWVQEKAAELHAECPEQPTKHRKPNGHRNVRKEKIAGLFDIQLFRETGWWMPDMAKGRLLVGRYAPTAYEDLRKPRIDATLNKKLPKLQAWKDNGARSVLILENGDISLSNHVIILEAVESGLAGRADPPDEVWLVDTTIEQEWTVWCLMRDGKSFPDEETPVRFREFKPSDLMKV